MERTEQQGSNEAQIPIEPDFELGDIVEELIEEFGPPTSQQQLDPCECYTTIELMDVWGIKKAETVRRRLHSFRREGRLIETTKTVEILGRPGSFTDVPAYQIIKKEKTDE